MAAEARAWLNDTGMKRSDALPSTTDRQKTVARTAILVSATPPRTDLAGVELNFENA